MVFNRSLVSSALLVLVMVVPGPVAALGDTGRNPGVRDLEAVAEAGSVSLSPVTGTIRSARFQPGRVAGDGASVGERASLFLLRHGAAFGADTPNAGLAERQTRTDGLGHRHLQYDQVHLGVPVFGARMRLHFDGNGELIAANANLIPDIRLTRVSPSISEGEAVGIARLVVGKQQSVAPSALTVEVAELVVFNDGVIWGRPGANHLAWLIEITDERAMIREQLFLDGHSGRVLERINLVENIERYISEISPSNVVWREGDPLPYAGSGGLRDEEINNLIDVAGQTYDTFLNISGGAFASWNGADIAMRSVYDRSGMSCPNATFDGSRTNFCVGTATDDVIAHEWVHGYTRSTHGLIYAWQSGALNESYSDIFGEVVDLLYDSGTDNPSTVRAVDSCSAATGFEEPMLTVEAPASLAGTMEVKSANFNPSPPWSVTAVVEAADDGVGLGNDACDPLVGFTPGNIALITMAGCPDRFLTPAVNAEAAGAVGVIITNPVNNNLVTMTGGVGRLGIPAVFLGRSDGDAIRAALADGVTVTISSSGDGSLRWLVGEDSTAFGGAIRDMWNPECLNDPGRVTSSNYYCGEGDGGGVHTNSSVPNHAFSLLVDGGAFNGFNVAAIGMTRAAHIYWRAMSVYQLPVSDLRDHAELLVMSCQDLVGAPLPDLLTGQVAVDVISPDHCTQVENAMLATEMLQWPSQCNFATVLDPEAPQRYDPFEVFGEDFAAEPAGWRLTNEGVFAEYLPRDWVWTEDVPDGGDGGSFFALDSPAVGNCRPGEDDQSGVMHLDSPAITLPAAIRPVLLFDHYVATEAGFDGGNLKISVNGGEFVMVPAGAFLFNPYNSELIDPEHNSNPMAGQEVFAGTDQTTYKGSWGQSQVDLVNLVGEGDTVVLRFDFGTDGCHGQDGWYLDSLRLLMTPRERNGGGSRVTPLP